MTQIQSDTVIPKGSVDEFGPEGRYEKKLRYITKYGATIIGFVILISGFALCCYVIVMDKPLSQQAFSVISGMIGAVFGFLYGTRRDA